MTEVQSTFTAEQLQVLNHVADLIIPADSSRGMPSAGEVNVANYLSENESGVIPLICEELDRVENDAQAAHNSPFAALSREKRNLLLDQLRVNDPRFMRGLAIATATCYYQDDRVLESLGMEARPPFPKGYEVDSGDTSLLDPVIERGQIYRNAPE